MPSRKRKTIEAALAAAAAMPQIPNELIDQFVIGPMSAEAVNPASMAFKKALIERALGAELSHHLGYAPGGEKPEEVSNHRNGASGKTVLTEDGPVRIEVPRDRRCGGGQDNCRRPTPRTRLAHRGARASQAPPAYFGERDRSFRSIVTARHGAT